MVDALVWNERSGNLVSGHQRLSIIDDLEGKSDYMIEVAVVRLTQKQEMGLNVFMNNPHAQGEFTEDLIDLQQAGLDLSSVGMSMDDLSSMFPDYLVEPTTALAAKEPEKAREPRQKNGEAPIKSESHADTLMITWPSRQEREPCLVALKFDPEQRFFIAKEFLQ